MQVDQTQIIRTLELSLTSFSFFYIFYGNLLSFSNNKKTTLCFSVLSSVMETRTSEIEGCRN